MQHPLSPPERLWLTELARSPGLSVRFAKVKLYGQLPSDFSPDRIDPRLYFAGRPTPIGLWHVDQYNQLFYAMDQVILDIQRRIRADPTITVVTAAEIAKQTEQTEEAVAEALYAVSTLGHFFTQAEGVQGNSWALSSFRLTDDTVYDEYLRYTELDELFERVYIERGQALEASIDYSNHPHPYNEAVEQSGLDVPGDDQGNEQYWNGVATEVRRAIQAGWANGMPATASAVYGRWWQLESWMRSLVYVELRASLGDHWMTALPRSSESRQQGEQAFRYMATPDAQDLLAYADASALFKITLEHWTQFEPALPSKGVWIGRIEELLAIRNRIGHCRRPHSDDLSRLEQTLRDLNGGAFAATAAFNNQFTANERWTDAVVAGWLHESHETAVRLIKHAARQYDTTFKLQYSRRPWAPPLAPGVSISGVPGYIWHAWWYFSGGRPFQLDRFWRDIEPFRDSIFLVCAPGPSSLSVSFAALEDAEHIGDMIGRCFDAALFSLGHGHEMEGLEAWQRRYAELDPRVHVASPWALVEDAMRGVSIFSA